MKMVLGPRPYLCHIYCGAVRASPWSDGLDRVTVITEIRVSLAKATSHARLVFLDPNSTHHCQPSVPATDHLPCWQTSSKSFTGTLSPGMWAFFAFVFLGHWQRLLTPMGRPYTSFYVTHLADSLVRASCLMGPKPIWDSVSWIKIQPSYSWPMCTGPTLDGPECHFRPSLHHRWPK